MISNPLTIAQSVAMDSPAIVRLDVVEAIAVQVERTVLTHLIDYVGGEGAVPVEILMRERGDEG